MPESPLGRDEGRELRDAIRELTGEFKAFRTEAGQTFVRQDTHQLDMRLLIESHNKDVALIQQTLTALKESMDGRIKEESQRVDKLEDDGDWLKKIIYGTIVVALLATFGFSSAASAGVFK